MYSLKMLGLAVLAGTCIVALVIGYNHFQGLSATKKAREEAHKLHSKIEHVIITLDNRSVSVEIPNGYTLEFESNQLLIDGIRFPDESYDMIVKGPKLEPGVHNLLISIENGKVFVNEVD